MRQEDPVLRMGAAMIAILISVSAARSQDTFFLENGRSFSGRLEHDDGETIRVHLETDTPGTAILTLKYSELAPRTIYRLKLGRTPLQNPEAQLALAEYALAHGLFDAARRHTARARELDPSMEVQISELESRTKRRAAAELLARAQSEVERGRVARAERLVILLLREFPHQPAASAGSQLLQRLAPQLEAIRRNEQSRQLAKAKEEFRAKLAPVEEAHAEGIRQARLALMQTSNTSRALQLLHSSIESCRRARRILKKLMARNAQIPRLTALAADLDLLVESHLAQTYVDRGSLYLVRGSYRDALENVNQALALDPDHDDAKSMRARIEIAANQNGWGGNWKRWAR